MRRVGLLSLLFLTSCVSDAEYPHEWPSFSSETYEGCPNIAGTYSDFAYETAPKHEMEYLRYRRLSSYLLPQEERKERKPPGISVKRKVTISQSLGGNLEVTLFEDDDTVIVKKSYSKQADDFRCDGKELIISDWGGEVGMVSGIGSWENGLNKGIDGSLILKNHSRGAGLGMLIFPFVLLSETEWLRYQRLD